MPQGGTFDDENPVLKPVQFGERLINDKLVICPEFIQQDKQVPHDKRTYDILQQIANKIWPNIQFTVDIPSECPSGLIPMLDMEVGINQVGQVTRQFYSKPMATPFTIPSRSAHTWQTKRSTLTQEGVRRLLNTSQNTSKIIRNDIMQQWDKKMNVSGYDEKFRTNVIRAAIKIYNHKVVTSEQGGRPLYRPTGWQSSERAIEKLVKRQTWYAGKGSERNQAPLIIDPTPSGQLELDIANILKDSARMSGTRVKLCLRGGDKVLSAAKSDPFASKLCDRADCPVCTSTSSKGGCRHANVGYMLSCDNCKQSDIQATYQGETSKSAYERGNQHAEGLIKKLEENPLWKHAELYHEGDNQIPFSMEITGRFQKAMIRQEDEAIRIRESLAMYQMNSKKEFHQPAIIRLVPVSNTQQADQTGTQAPIMERGRNHNKRSLQINHSDSPNVPPRSRVRYNHHKSHQSPQPVERLNTVQSTRKERQNLAMKQAISRSVMRDHPSIVAKSEHERNHYKSPSVNRRFKPTNSPRMRSVSPVQVRRHRREQNENSKSHHKSATTVEKPVDRKKQMKEHHSNQHNKHQSLSSTPPHSSKNIKNTKKNRYVQPPHGASNISPLQHTSSKNHSETNSVIDLSLSPISPESLSFCLRKLAGTTQGAIPLSLSPVSQTNLTQFLQSCQSNTNSNSNSNSSSKPSLSPSLSPMSPTKFTQAMANLKTTSTVTNSSSDSSSDSNEEEQIISDIPNVFKCHKEKSITKGEKAKNPTHDSDEIPLVNLLTDSDINSTDIESLSDEFNTSWGEENIQTVNKTQPNLPKPFKNPFSANKQPIDTIEQLEQLKLEALKKSRFDKIKRIRRVNSKNSFESEIKNLEKTFLKPITPKKRTPRKTAKRDISYLEKSFC